MTYKLVKLVFICFISGIDFTKMKSFWEKSLSSRFHFFASVYGLFLMHLVRSYLCSAVDIYGLRNHLPNGNGKNVMGKGGERKRGYEKKNRKGTHV